MVGDWVDMKNMNSTDFMVPGNRLIEIIMRHNGGNCYGIKNRRILNVVMLTCRNVLV